MMDGEPREVRMWECPVCFQRYLDRMVCEDYIATEHVPPAEETDGLVGRWVEVSYGPSHRMLLRVDRLDGGDRVSGPSLKVWGEDGDMDFDTYDWCHLGEGFEVVGDDDDARRRWMELVEGAMPVIRDRCLSYFDSLPEAP